MTATSDPGFSLMQEGLSFAYKLRIPLVIVNSMRMGPSTGMPTIGSQQDISLVGAGGTWRYLMHGGINIKERY